MTQQRLHRVIYLAAILASFLFSYIASQRSIINPDGICYLMSAEDIGTNSLSHAMRLCMQSHWPLFSILIHGLHTFTHLSYATAGYTINAWFSAWSVFMFILIVQRMGGQGMTLLYAAITILFAHEFNAVREYIVRDHGFWAFYLTSIWLMMRYLEQPTLKWASCWHASLFLAALFRIEGSIFLFALPFLVWFNKDFTWKQRTYAFFKLHVPSICLLAMLVMVVSFYQQDILKHVGRYHEVYEQLQYGTNIIVERFAHAKAQLAAHVLTPDSAGKAGVVLVLMIASWFIVSLIVNLSFGYSLLVGYAWIKKLQLPRPAVLVMLAYLILNLMITLVFLLEHFFLSKRYLVASSLVLMFWIPFALTKLSEKKFTRLHLTYATAIALFIIASAVSGIFDFGYSKFYIKNAGNWLAKEVPSNAKLYANDFQLMYYSKHYGNDIFKLLPTFVTMTPISEKHWREYDYIALRLTKHQKKHLPSMNGFVEPPVQMFSNKRGDKVVIYKIDRQAKL